MAYEVIARKWRPKVFEDLIGQAHIGRTLKSAITRNRVGHAYLFAGLRGIGKTSSARVFARALRCERRLADGNPCNMCPACMEIFEGRAMDVLEIDGASNNGVDAIRELREQAHYMPSSGVYKIYIIDEVHMLSASAFNALLKVLEEPPPHLVFLFATTEPQDLPETILSRVQRFDFKRVPEPLMVEHIRHICTTENIAIDDESLHLLASASEGSMRDSQSMLDQLISAAEGEITAQLAESVLGLVGHRVVRQTLAACLDKDVPAMLAIVNRLFVQGFDFHYFLVRLLEAVRDCHFLSLYEGPDSADLSDRSIEDNTALKVLSTRWSVPQWRMAFQILSRGLERLRNSPAPRLSMEMLLARLMELDEVVSLSEALTTLNESPTGSAPATIHARAVTPAGASIQGTVGAKAASPAPKGAVPKATAAASNPAPGAGDPTEKWSAWIDLLRTQRPSLALAFEGIQSTLRLPVIQLQVPSGSLQLSMMKDPKVQKDVAPLAKSHFGCDVQWKFEETKPSTTGHLTDAESKTQQVLSDERIQMAQKFLGAEVESVKLFHND